jgi:hypothetical protein
MAKARCRSCILVAFLVLAMACAQRATAADGDIPPLRTKDSVLVLTHMMRPTLDVIPPPISSIPDTRPFKAIGLDVRWGNDETLAEFARRAMELRLEELDVAGQIHVIHPPSAGTEGSPPPGVSDCDVLRVTFVFSTAVHTAGGQDVFALAADMLATQPVSEERTAGEWQCLEGFPRQQWALQVGPRLGVLPGRGENAAELQRRAILSFIDTEIVRKILSSNKTAAETLRSWTPDLAK